MSAARDMPTATDFRAQAALRDRRMGALAAVSVVLLALLVFWLLPPPAVAAPGQTGAAAPLPQAPSILRSASYGPH